MANDFVMKFYGTHSDQMAKIKKKIPFDKLIDSGETKLKNVHTHSNTSFVFCCCFNRQHFALENIQCHVLTFDQYP